MFGLPSRMIVLVGNHDSRLQQGTVGIFSDATVRLQQMLIQGKVRTSATVRVQHDSERKGGIVCLMRGFQHLSCPLHIPQICLIVHVIN